MILIFLDSDFFYTDSNVRKVLIRVIIYNIIYNIIYKDKKKCHFEFGKTSLTK